MINMDTRTWTNKEVRLLEPCIDPIEFYSDDESYTLEDILMNDRIKDRDKIWVVTKLIGNDDDTTKINRRLAIYTANYAIAKCDEAKIGIDQSIRNAPKVALAYLDGAATKDDLANAYSAARSAVDSARSATDSAADFAILSVALSAALSAAYSAAYSAADSAAYSAAYSVAYSAPRSAAYYAAHSATNSAPRSGAYSVAYSSFVSELLRLINE